MIRHGHDVASVPSDEDHNMQTACRYRLQFSGIRMICGEEKRCHVSTPFSAPSENQAASDHSHQSLTPSEELAYFLAYRGRCLEGANRLDEARQAYSRAHRLAPEDAAYMHWYASVVHREATALADEHSKQRQQAERDRRGPQSATGQPTSPAGHGPTRPGQAWQTNPSGMPQRPMIPSLGAAAQ
jgi:hypothetical protein